MDRLIRIFVRDRHNRPLPGSRVDAYVDGEHYGEIQQSEGGGSIQLPSGSVRVDASYPGEENQSVLLDENQNSYTFQFDVNGGYSPVKRDLIAAIPSALLVVGLVVGAFYLGFRGGVLPLAVGGVLLATALSLAFTFKEPTLLQAQLIRSTFALAAGALATQIPGFINVDLSLGEQAAITAGGALAVFVLVFFFTPAKDT